MAIQHFARSESPPVFRHGSREWSLHAEIARRPFDVLIEKTWPDSFAETGLQDWLAVPRAKLNVIGTMHATERDLRQCPWVGPVLQ